jgi:[NiFe] hydrogenase diaphorase moiety large subunit
VALVDVHQYLPAAERLSFARVWAAAPQWETTVSEEGFDAGRLDALLRPVVDRHGGEPGQLVQILREAQGVVGYLPAAALTAIARALGLPRAQVEGVAGFYSFFHLTPPGRYRVLFSDNITDRMLGSGELLDRLCNKLWVERGKVSEDGLVSVDTTSCTGMCDQGPALLVNGQALTRLSGERVERIGELIRAQAPLADWPAEYFRVDDNIRRRDTLLSAEWPAGAALRAAIARGGEAMLAEMKLSNLRGRGGAGFTTAIKWESARRAECHAEADGRPAARYVVCNADEGEPGTFKDRVLLASYADLVFDGMSVAALTIGARQGLLYLRGEYAYLLPALRENLERRRRSGLLGRAVCGQAGLDFEIDIHVGAGAYVCGEETALLESLEGKRGIPRIRPPFPVTAGYRGQPTVVNNVETLCKAALIALKGRRLVRRPGHQAIDRDQVAVDFGRRRDAGNLRVSVRRFGQPGAAGLRRRQRAGGAGQRPFRDLPGDARILAQHRFRGRADGRCAFMVFGTHRDMFEVARNFAHFFAARKLRLLYPVPGGHFAGHANCMDKIAKGLGTQYEINQVFKIHRLLHAASHCGLGQAACNPLLRHPAEVSPGVREALCARSTSSRLSTSTRRWRRRAR